MLRITEEIKEILFKGERIGEEMKLNVEGGNMLLTSSSKENMVFQAIFRDVESDKEFKGQMTLDKTALAVIKKAPNEIDLEKVSENEIKFISNDFKGTLQEPEKVQEHAFNLVKGKSTIKFDIERAKDVLYATSTEELRPTLTGVCFRIIDETYIDIVALDGFRVSKVRIEYTLVDGEAVTNGTEFIIAKNSLNKILNVFTGEVNVNISEKEVYLNKWNILIAVGIFEGKYIEYERLIETVPNEKSIIVSRALLIDAINRCSICSKNPISLIQQGDKLTVRTKENKSVFEESLNSKATEDFTIHFNIKYLVEMLNTFCEDEISINFTNQTSPIKIRENDLEAILLPVRNVVE